MAKRILFAVMCTLLVLMIIMGGIVLNKVNALLSVAQPPSGSAYVPPPETDPPENDPDDEPERPDLTPHDHVFTMIESIEATCTAYGYNVYACECGKTHLPNDEFTNPIGHDYEAGEPVELTCTQDGYVPYTCKNCGDVDKRELQEAPGHDYGDWVTVSDPEDAAPGCRERICDVCEDVETQWLQPLGVLEIQTQTDQTLTDDEDVEFIRYTVIVGTALTPDAYIYTVDSYISDPLYFAYGEEGLAVYVAEFPEDLLHRFALYESGSWTLKVEPPTDPELDQNDPTQDEETE